MFALSAYIIDRMYLPMSNDTLYSTFFVVVAVHNLSIIENAQTGDVYD